MISIITSLYRTDKYLDGFSRHLKKFAGELKAANLAFEVIAIANEATEREKQFALDFAGEDWFSFFNVGRESVFATFNRGFALAKGEILGFWNADDVRYASSLIEAQSLFAQGTELVYFPFIVKRYFKIGPWSLPLLWQKVDKQIPEFTQATSEQFKKGMLCGPFFLFTKSLYQKVGPFDEQFKIAGDFDWCVRAAYKTGRFVKAKSLGGVFRVDGGGLSAGANPRRTAENNVVYMRYHMPEKISPADNLLMQEYRPGFLKSGTDFIELKD